ncbi:unnamed protein product [Dovyalis caffra]|uniref:Uncharacterized protein n=1 Tax=Dovyalis caffra TaxID=77055 RepID=A0AAV1R7R1_9ROSI|nr:unnamed protein product [Dovyalis caffra]
MTIAKGRAYMAWLQEVEHLCMAWLLQHTIIEGGAHGQHGCCNIERALGRVVIDAIVASMDLRSDND